MGILSDIGEFELFQLGDWWDKIKENPEQLLLGAGDPFSAGLWSGITGKDYEPFVNVLGGPMGGDTLGIGSGGIYDRAQEAGIDTKYPMLGHDIAETVAAMYAGGYGLDKLGGLGGTGGELTGVEVTPAERSGSLLGGEGGGGLLDFGSMDWSSPQTYMDLLGSMPQGGGMGGQQQQQPLPPMARPGASNFAPLSQLAYGGRTPESRTAIIGLLGLPEDTTDEEMKALLGGIL